MKSGIIHSPFTMSQGVYPRMIVSPIEVTTSGAKSPGSIFKLTSVAQWDTGADNCLICRELVKTLRLESCGNASIYCAGGEYITRNSYLVNLILPNGIFFEGVLAIEDPCIKQTGIDFLVGLSVINELDFAISHNNKGDSVLSISYPADRLVDFSND